MSDWLDEAIREADAAREKIIGPRPALGCRWPVEDCFCPPPYADCGYEARFPGKRAAEEGK